MVTQMGLAQKSAVLCTVDYCRFLVLNDGFSRVDSFDVPPNGPGKWVSCFKQLKVTKIPTHIQYENDETCTYVYTVMAQHGSKL